MRIQAVAFRGFPPFADVEIEFPAPEVGHRGVENTASPNLGRVHLITGQNGTGKTRLLSLFAAACGNPKELLDRIGPDAKAYAFVKLSAGENEAIWGPFNADGVRSGHLQPIKDSARWLEVVASRDPHARITPDFPNTLAWPAAKDSMALAFRGTARAGDAKIVAISPLQIGKLEDQLTFDRPQSEDALICQSMANLKVGAAMEQLRRGTETSARATDITSRMEAAITTVTGRRFAFDVSPSPEVHLKVFWGGVKMRIAECPDGLRSIIGWLVSCIAKLDAKFPEHPNPLDVPVLLLLDEPESHLHPAWQRQLVPAAQLLFPNSQIFIATHSPFVISSVNFGWIHVLRANDKGLVTADKPIPCSPGDTYLDVVSDILGIQEWYDPETENLLAEFRSIRKNVLDGADTFNILRGKAEVIAARSESLSNMMARELRQMERLMTTGVAES